MVKLAVKVSTSTENPKVNMNVNIETALIDYVGGVNSAEIGNHVQLRKYCYWKTRYLYWFSSVILVLKKAQPAYEVMNDYALSLNQCWASKTDEVTDHTYDNTTHILLWDEFCPEFPWVGPLAYNTDQVSLPTHVSSLSLN